MNPGATASTRSSLTNTEVPWAFTPVTTRLMDMDAILSTYAPAAERQWIVGFVGDPVGRFAPHLGVAEERLQNRARRHLRAPGPLKDPRHDRATGTPAARCRTPGAAGVQLPAAPAEVAVAVVKNVLAGH
jgi:hypothetical protein